MFVYILLLLIPFFFEAIEATLQPILKTDISRKHSNNSIIVFFIIFFFMLAMRSISCGNDVSIYRYFFELSFNQSFSDMLFGENLVEPLYMVLNGVVSHVYYEYRFFLTIVAFLTVFFVALFYKRESENSLLTILLFATNVCFTICFSGLRQAIAMQFIIPAYYLTKQKKIISFIAVVLLATYFHSSAIIMLLLYPIFYISIESKHFTVVLLLVFISFVFRVQIFSSSFNLIERYAKYAVIEETGGYAMYLFFIACLIIAFLYPDEQKMTIEIKGLRNVMVLMTIIQGFASIHPLAMRMNYYFIMLFPIALPKILSIPQKGDEKAVRLTTWCFVIFLTVLFVYTVYSNMGIKTIYPYRAYWE